MNESPVNFNIWSAISVVSSILKDNVWIDRGNYKIFPNQYIVLVSKPGMGKGTAIKPAHSFVKFPPNNVSLANYIEDRITTPKLIETLAAGFSRVHFNNGNLLNSKEAVCVLQAEELSTMINNSDWLTDFLVKTWEGGNFIYNTKSGGKTVINDICISLIAACTQDFIKKINKNHGAEVSNGFTARTIFVHSNQRTGPKPKPKGFQHTDNLITKDKLDNDLGMISQLYGEFMFTPSADAIYEKKYVDIYNSISDEDSNVVQDFKARQNSHILKLAMTFSAARRDDLVIDDFAINSAITLVDGVLQTLDIVFGGVGDSELAEGLAMVQLYIEHKKVCSFGELLKTHKRNITPENLNRILMVLEDCGIISSYTQNSKKFFVSGGGIKP